MIHRRQVTAVLATLMVVLVLGLVSPAAAASPATNPPPLSATAAYSSSGVSTGPDSLSVDRLYRAFFLRAPDAGGLAYWRGLHSAGRPLSAIALGFAQSEEFRTRYGSLNDSEFVNLVYRNVMGRAADTGGLTHWTDMLASGRLSRGGVMLSFSDAAEFKTVSGLIGTSAEVVVRSSTAGVRDLTVIDRSGRNLSRALPALNPRNIYVRANFPAAANGQPRTDRAWLTHVIGAYRNGATPECPDTKPTDRIVVCVGFPRMDRQSGIAFGDIPNHHADVGVVLDALIGDANLAGRIDASRIVYSGASMGGITGLGFANQAAHDPRIRAVVSWVGVALFTIPEVGAMAAWSPSAPPVLMINAHDDPSITYDLARTTFQHAPAGKVTLVTIHAGNGGHSPRCAAADQYAAKWLDHHLLGTPLPSDSTLTGCAAAGLVPGGSTGLGLLGASAR